MKAALSLGLLLGFGLGMPTAAQAQAKQCPPGQIFRVKKNVCAPKSESLKFLGEASAPSGKTKKATAPAERNKSAAKNAAPAVQRAPQPPVIAAPDPLQGRREEDVSRAKPAPQPAVDVTPKRQESKLQPSPLTAPSNAQALPAIASPNRGGRARQGDLEIYGDLGKDRDVPNGGDPAPQPAQDTLSRLDPGPVPAPQPALDMAPVSTLRPASADPVKPWSLWGDEHRIAQLLRESGTEPHHDLGPLNVGDTVPMSVKLEPLPEAVRELLPVASDLTYVASDDAGILVLPYSRRVLKIFRE